MCRLLFVGLLMSVVPVPTVAQTIQDPSKGNGLLAMCEADTSGWGNGFCSGFVSAASDIGIGIGVICYPAGVNNKQIREVAIAGLRANPGERHKQSAALVMRYLREAFPCNPSK